MEKTLTTSNIIAYMHQYFPDVKIYNSTVDKSKPCIGVYKKGDFQPKQTIGVEPSVGGFDITILFQTSEDANEAENLANSVYEKFNRVNNITISNIRIVSFECLTQPIFVGRNEKNLVELTLRVRVLYERW